MQCRSLCRHWATAARRRIARGFPDYARETDSPAVLVESLLHRGSRPGRWRSFAWRAGVGVFLSPFECGGSSVAIRPRRPYPCVRFLPAWPVRTAANYRNGANRAVRSRSRGGPLTLLAASSFAFSQNRARFLKAGPNFSRPPTRGGFFPYETMRRAPRLPFLALRGLARGQLRGRAYRRGPP